MRTFLVISVIASVLALGCAFAGAYAQGDAVEGGYAAVNGLELYYEIHGEGQPLVLLHGGLGGIGEFGQLLPLLAENQQVIAVELQGHGRTADIDRPLSYELLADDVAALIQNLGYESADIMGFSLGGGVALQTAIRHPEAVRRLVLVSTSYSRDSIYPEFRAGMEVMNAEAAGMMLETPMYQFYVSVAPRPEDWPVLVGKVGDLLRQDYDWTADAAAITSPTLIVLGDSDMIHPEHAVELFGLLGGGVAGDFAGLPRTQLAVLPGTTHFSILTRPDLLLPVVTAFLVTPVPVP
jgi:pimeloyl-ACP methyl ester carboxylesterase